MTRPFAFAPLLILLAACQVTVVPPAGKPGTSVVIAASAKPGQATPRPGPTSAVAPAEPGARITAGVIDELTLPADARAGEEVRLSARVVLSNGCASLQDAKAEVDQAARRVTVSARVARPGGDVACATVVVYARPEVAFTPESAGTWTIVTKGYDEKPTEKTLEVLAAGATPKPTAPPTAAPTSTPTSGPMLDEAGWTQEALRFSSLTPPAAAKVGVGTAITYVATVGSSSCARFQAAAAEVDAAARTVRLAGTKRVAPPGTACTKDLRSQEGVAAVTLPAAGTWLLTAPGAADTSFEVAP